MDVAQLIGPFVLFGLMLVVGMELTLADFRRVASAPRAVVGGTLAQILLLPLMTFGVVLALGVPPVFAAGAVILAVSPGAGISNILTALAGANIALSVTLTATMSVLSVLTLPPIASFGIRWFAGDAIDVDVPVGALMLQLSWSLLLPIGVGMAIRARWPESTVRRAPRLQRITVGVIALILVAAMVGGDNQGLSFGDARAGLVAAGVWTLSAMALGWGLAAALGLPSVDRFTFLIEFSARNVAVATIVAMSGLARPDLMLFTGAYVAVGYPLAAVAVVWRRRQIQRILRA